MRTHQTFDGAVPNSMQKTMHKMPTVLRVDIDSYKNWRNLVSGRGVSFVVDNGARVKKIIGVFTFCA